MPRPSSPVHAKASTRCSYLTLENPHHHQQACITLAMYQVRTISQPDRTTHRLAEAMRPLPIMCVACSHSDRNRRYDATRHRSKKPIHNVKEARHTRQYQTTLAHGRNPFLHPRRISRRAIPPFEPHSGENGGAYRDRTDDPLLAKQVLSQLS